MFKSFYFYLTTFIKVENGNSNAVLKLIKRVCFLEKFFRSYQHNQLELDSAQNLGDSHRCSFLGC